MRRLTRAVMLAAVGVAIGACGSSPSSAPTLPEPPTATKPAPPPAVLTEAAPPVQVYDAKGRRDPFDTQQDARDATKTLNVATAKLTGILRGQRATLALVETPDGLGYILRLGDTLGDGRLVEIGLDNVVFSIAPRPGVITDRVVLKLPGD